MSNDIKNSCQQWTAQLELVFKSNPLVKEYEILTEVTRQNIHIGGLDKRNRWNNRLDALTHVDFQYRCRIFLEQGGYSEYCAQKSVDDQPVQILHRMLEPQNIQSNLQYNQPFHNLDNNFTDLDIFDARFPKITEEDRFEIMQDNAASIRSLNKKAKVLKITLSENEHGRYFLSSSQNPLWEPSTTYHLEAEISLGEQIQKLHHRAHRFADICSRPIAWDIIKPLEKSIPNSANFDPKWMLMLPPQIVANLVGLLPPAFDLKLWESGQSFLAAHVGRSIGSKRVHLIDDPTLFSGLNTRSFDGRGVPSKTLTLINEGVVNDCYVSLDNISPTRKPTGHRDLNGQLWVGNLMTHLGKRSQNMILADKSDALLATNLLEPISLDIQTGNIYIVANYVHISAAGIVDRLGIRTISCPIFDLFHQIIETANDQNRFDHIDSSSWILEDCSLLQ